MSNINYLRLFLLSFLFAYNGGLLVYFENEFSGHTIQIILAAFGFILGFNSKVFKNAILINKNILIPFFLLIIYFQFHISTNTPMYGQYKITLLWWNFIATIFLITGVKTLKELEILILFGIIQLSLGILLAGLDFTSYRFGVGGSSPITVSRMGGILFIFGIFYTKKKNILIRVLALSVGFIALLLSGTRTLYLSIAFVFGVMLFYNNKSLSFKFRLKNTARHFIYFTFLITFFAVILSYNLLNVNIELIERIDSAFYSISSFSTFDNSTATRAHMWDLAYNDWLESPIFGKGLGNFGYTFTSFDQRQYPHNMLYEILAEGGVLGLFLLLIFIINLWKSIKKNRNPYLLNFHKFTIALFFISIISSMSSLEISNQFLLFLSAALIGINAYLNKKINHL